MRLERLTSDKIKIFLTFDDLQERGISKEEIWKDIPKIHDLFRDMIIEASEELDFEAEGPVMVEVFALPSQGMVIIVTVTDDDDYFDDSFLELQITMDVNDSLLFEFDDVEDVIQLAKRLASFSIDQSVLYHFDDKYYLSIKENDSYPLDVETLVALIVEYGDTATITGFRLHEYGNIIMKKDALRQLHKIFQ